MALSAFCAVLVISLSFYAVTDAWSLESLLYSGAFQNLFKSRDAGSLQKRITSGATVESDPCKYPGVIAISFGAADSVICHGVYSGGTVTIPNSCKALMDLLNSIFDMKIHGQDGSATSTITKGTFPNNAQVSTLNSDLYTFPVAVYSSSVCPSVDYIPYDASSATANCVVASYGGEAADWSAFSNELRVSPIDNVITPSSGLLNTVISHQELGTVDQTNPTSSFIFKATYGICTPDLGAPIYCETTGGQWALAGLVAANECSDDTFNVADDMTSGTLNL